MTPIEVAKEIFPGRDDAFLDHAIWGRTGYPGFFSLKAGQRREDRFREQLIEFRDALNACPKGKHLCEHCNNFVSKKAWHCIPCDWNRVFELNEM